MEYVILALCAVIFTAFGYILGSNRTYDLLIDALIDGGYLKLDENDELVQWDD
jgi:hypothetical protein